jgi:hypothetical protein
MNLAQHHRALVKSYPVKLVVAFLAATLLTACQHVNHLRDAQNAFNTAAQLDNEIRFAADRTEDAYRHATSPDQALVQLTAVQSAYATALHSIRQADPAKLRDDQLLGVALTLQAMSEWRLGQYTNALATRDRALQTASDQLMPRDEAILRALPGLVKTDLAYDRIVAMGADEAANRTLLDQTIRPRLVGPQGAIEDIAQARHTAPANHPVQIYLIQCQLAAYRNYQIAHQKAHGGNPPLTDAAHLTAQRHLAELREFGQKNDQAALTDRLLKFWLQFGIRPANP